MEEIVYGGKTIIMDGAHNAQKLHALSQSVRNKYPDKSIAGLVSFVGQRSYRLEHAVKELLQLLDHSIITSFNSPQDSPHASVDTDELLKIFNHYDAKSVQIVTDPAAALQKLLDRPEKIVLVAGSFYLLNHIRPLLFNRINKRVS
jgi:folylpolyglutamate synthase/dihydropteroate synthase